MSIPAGPVRKACPSDISAGQFERVRPLLESARSKIKPLEVVLHWAFNGVLYVLREGCRRCSLPYDYPGWSTVYDHFRT